MTQDASTDRLERLQRVTDAALAHLDPDELLDELLERIREILEADTAAILMLDPSGEELVARAARGLEEEVERGVRIPVGGGFAGRIAAERRPIALDDIDHAEILNPLLREKGIRSLLGVPLLTGGDVLGVLHVGTLVERHFTGEDQELLQIVADRAAVAIDRASAYDAERTARREAERAVDRLERLQHVTDPSLAHLSLEALLEEMLERIRELVDADTAAILMLDEERDELVARAARGLEEEVERGVRIPVGRGFAGRIAAERRPIALDDLEHAEILNPLFREKGIRALLGVPLLSGGAVLGVLHVGTLVDRHFTEQDQELLQVVADRAAVAIEHARLFQAEHDVATTLQRSLLPAKLPDVPGVKVAAAYLPARLDADIGGDWYEVIPLRGLTVGLAVGDVVGEGIGAAAMMGQLRSGLRAYALEGHPPGTVLDRLNLLLRVTAGRQMATAAYAVLDLESSTLSYANAGHLPPVVCAEDTEHGLLDTPRGPPLGVVGYPAYEEAQIELPPGARLLLVTDGLIERPEESLDEGLERLRRALRDAPGDPDAAVAHLIEQTLPNGTPNDDVAVLLLELEVPDPDRLHLELPADPSQLTLLRRRLAPWLQAAGTSPDVAYDITVACTEACANAIEHAYNPGDAAFVLDGFREGSEVEITVRDFGQWRPPRGVHRGRGLVMMESLMDSLEVDRGEKGTTVRLRRRLDGEVAA